MGMLNEREALNKYDETYQAAFHNGLYADDMSSEWLDFTWTPLPGDSAGDNIALTDMATLEQGLFGEGNPLKYTNMAFYEMFLAAQRRALGFAADRDKLTEDRAGLYSQAAFHLGAGASQFRWLNFYDLMCGAAFTGANGFTSFDDTTLISDSHPYRDVNGVTQFYSNKTTAVFSETAWISALEKINLFRMPMGSYTMKPTQRTLVIGPKYEDLVRKLFESRLRDVGNAAIDNTLVKPDRIVISKALTESRKDFWFIFLTYPDPSAKAVLYKNVLDATLRMNVDPNSDLVRTENKYCWWVEQKYGFSAGHPAGVYGSDGTV